MSVTFLSSCDKSVGSSYILLIGDMYTMPCLDLQWRIVRKDTVTFHHIASYIIIYSISHVHCVL